MKLRTKHSSHHIYYGRHCKAAGQTRTAQKQTTLGVTTQRINPIKYNSIPLQYRYKWWVEQVCEQLITSTRQQLAQIRWYGRGQREATEANIKGPRQTIHPVIPLALTEYIMAPPPPPAAASTSTHHRLSMQQLYSSL
jgi:hypothetical protein